MILVSHRKNTSLRVSHDFQPLFHLHDVVLTSCVAMRWLVAEQRATATSKRRGKMIFWANNSWPSRGALVASREHE
jgi:hypothetical protein